MYATGGALRDVDRKRLRTSVVVSTVLWAMFLPLLSLLRYEGPVVEPSMNPVYIELEPAPPERSVVEQEPPEEAEPAETSSRERAAPEIEEVEIAEETSSAAAPRADSPAETREGPSTQPVPEVAAATPSLRPDPSAPLAAARRPVPIAARGGSEPLAPLAEDALKAPSAPPAPTPGSPPPVSAAASERTSSSAASPGSRADAFDKTLRNASERLAMAPTGSTGSQGPSAAGASAASRQSRADLDGGFDFGSGAKRELLSPRRIRVPDRLLAGLPETVSTTVSFRIESGGTVYKSSIRFDPPLPDDLAAYLRTAFSGWQFSFADSDGQVVFRYSIKVK